MAHEGEKSLRDEVDALLPEPVQSSGQDCGCKESRYGNQCRRVHLVSLGSVILNIILAIMLLRERFESRQSQKSPYADLSFDTVHEISHLGPYGPNNENETERAILWESLDGSSAQVAIDKSWAASKGLPPTPEFSWDKAKAVYSLRGFHGQHCLRKIYRWVAISYHSGTQLDQYEHVLHCLDSILQDVRCLADDTPMIYSPGSWGQGQQRQCRDWTKLEKWAVTHNACYVYVNETQGVDSMFNRYKWCPQDSPYRARMRATLGLPDEWNPQVPKGIDSLPPYWEHF